VTTDESDPLVVRRWVEVTEGIALSIETEGVKGEWVQSPDYLELSDWL
jgi:hypothetical protein